MTEFFSAGLAIGSMRDTGYRDAAAALAEIIDNSVQAKARRVEVLIAEKEMRVVSKASWQADRIAVLDNGTGMTSEVLIAALQFQNGAYKQDHSGIGKFGMGLPQSSISSAGNVDVWTWQNGPENAIHTFLDIDAIEGGDSQIPTPGNERFRRHGETAQPDSGRPARSLSGASSTDASGRPVRPSFAIRRRRWGVCTGTSCREARSRFGSRRSTQTTCEARKRTTGSC